MFGYIKPFVPDLKVRENELYKAVYCGLCRSMKKHTGEISRLTLNYDFVFLALVRFALTNEKIDIKMKRCVAHPTKKRPYICDNPTLEYCAAVASVLTRAKLYDDITDTKGFCSFLKSLLKPFCNHMEKRAKNGRELPTKAIYSCLEKLSLLEKNNCESVDCCADVFGELLSEIFAFGLEDGNRKIAFELGKSVGRYIYVIDAIDDREKDKKSGSFNPLNISNADNNTLGVAVRLELEKAASAVELIDFYGMPEIEGVIKNTVYVGLVKIADNLLSGKDKK